MVAKAAWSEANALESLDQVDRFDGSVRHTCFVPRDDVIAHGATSRSGVGERVLGERVATLEVAAYGERPEAYERGLVVESPGGVIGVDRVRMTRLGVAVRIRGQRLGRLPQRASKQERRTRKCSGPDDTRRLQQACFGTRTRLEERRRVLGAQPAEREHERQAGVVGVTACRHVVGQPRPIAVRSPRTLKPSPSSWPKRWVDSNASIAPSSSQKPMKVKRPSWGGALIPLPNSPHTPICAWRNPGTVERFGGRRSMAGTERRAPTSAMCTDAIKGFLRLAVLRMVPVTAVSSK